MVPLLIASTVISAVGAIAQGAQASNAAEAQAQAMEYNAAGDRLRSEQASKVAGMQEDQQRRQARVAIGNQLAASAQSGAGLNGDLLRQSLYDSEMDSLAIRYDGATRAAGLNDQATLGMANAKTARAQGSAAMASGVLSAAGSLAQGGSSYYIGQKKGIY